MEESFWTNIGEMIDETTINRTVLLNCLFIFIARVADVSLGTLRTLTVVRGQRLAAWALGFVEILIWVLVISQVIISVRKTLIYAFFYALGFATGGYVGMTIERWLAFGERMVLLFSRKGEAVADLLRKKSYAVTEWSGRGMDGSITLMLLDVPRRAVREVIGTAKSVDSSCFYIVENINSSECIRPTLLPRTGWRTANRKAK